MFLASVDNKIRQYFEDELTKWINQLQENTLKWMRLEDEYLM